MVNCEFQGFGPVVGWRISTGIDERIVDLVMAGEKATPTTVSTGDFNPGGLAIGAI